ncbi:MAG: hypothetical protein ACPHO6_13805, partial [Candidatus Latescibacterota bacterium]
MKDTYLFSFSRHSIAHTLGVILTVFSVVFAHADEFVVPSQWPTINDAIAQAQAGDELRIEGGTS